MCQWESTCPPWLCSGAGCGWLPAAEWQVACGIHGHASKNPAQPWSQTDTSSSSSPWSFGGGARRSLSPQRPPLRAESLSCVHGGGSWLLPACASKRRGGHGGGVLAGHRSLALSLTTGFPLRPGRMCTSSTPSPWRPSPWSLVRGSCLLPPPRPSQPLRAAVSAAWQRPGGPWFISSLVSCLCVASSRDLSSLSVNQEENPAGAILSHCQQFMIVCCSRAFERGMVRVQWCDGGRSQGVVGTE